MAEAVGSNTLHRRHTPAGKKYPSTVGRGRAVKEIVTTDVTTWSDEFISVQLGDSLELYREWETPTVIVSDGGYGVLAFR